MLLLHPFARAAGKMKCGANLWSVAGLESALLQTMLVVVLGLDPAAVHLRKELLS